MVLSMCAHNLLFKCSLKSFHLPGNFFYLLLIAPLRLSCGAQRFMSLLLSSFFFFLTKDAHTTVQSLIAENPRWLKELAGIVNTLSFCTFPSLLKALF